MLDPLGNPLFSADPPPFSAAVFGIGGGGGCLVLLFGDPEHPSYDPRVAAVESIDAVLFVEEVEDEGKGEKQGEEIEPSISLSLSIDPWQSLSLATTPKLMFTDRRSLMVSDAFVTAGHLKLLPEARGY